MSDHGVKFRAIREGSWGISLQHACHSYSCYIRCRRTVAFVRWYMIFWAINFLPDLLLCVDCIVIPGSPLLWRYRVLRYYGDTWFSVTMAIPGSPLLWRYRVLRYYGDTRFFVTMVIPGSVLLWRYQVFRYYGDTRFCVTMAIPGSPLLWRYRVLRYYGDTGFSVTMAISGFPLLSIIVNQSAEFKTSLFSFRHEILRISVIFAGKPGVNACKQ